MGKISGKDSGTAIILTAHFDAWFNGAVDNASGVATVLEIAKLLKDTSKKE
ncbi:MAG: M28 family peptidase, partial [Clostridioides difficile]|nr:M28 family peptidase [Clostridioides difficile]